MKARGLSLAALAALVSGGALAAAFPRVDAGAIAWAALVPLVVAARTTSVAGAALLGFVAGVPFFLVLVEWVRVFDCTAWVALTLLQACYVALFAALARFFSPAPHGWRAVLVPAAAWTTAEWLRTYGTFAFTWGGLAYTQYRNLPLMQLASLVGPFGITFLIAAANGAMASLVAVAWPLLRRRHVGDVEGADGATGGSVGLAVTATALRAAGLRLVAVVLVIALAWAWGAARLGKAPGRTDTVCVAVLQGSIGGEGDRTPWPREKVEQSAAVYLELTERAARAGAQLVVWPESAVPGGVEANPALAPVRDRIVAVARRLGVSVIVGSSHPADGGRLFNSAFLYTPEGGLSGRYDKVHLVPFGEYTPLRKQLDFLYRHFPVIDYEFRSGKGFLPVATPLGTVGIAICFESAFPYITRALRRAGARLLVVTTNDAWFGNRSATWQHYRMAAFRAIETGAPVARSATTGFSAIVDPFGRTLAESRLEERRALVATVPLATHPTLYMAVGDAVAWASALALGVLLLRRRRK